MNTYFNCHTHTMYSNIRLLDCINRPKDLINTAKELGLVDELGGLDKAIEIASQKADLEAYSIINYPAQGSFFDTLLKEGKENYIQGKIEESLGEYYHSVKFLQNIKNMDRIQARMPFDLQIQ